MERKRIPLQERFWAKVDKSSHPHGCWLWTGAKTRSGYGRIGIDGHQRPAHRIALVLVGQLVPKGMDTCHKCDNPTCVNPAHLFVGTRAENVADMTRKHRGIYVGKPCALTAAQVKEASYMLKSGKSRGEVAHYFGVSETTINRVERGCYHPMKLA